MWCQLILDFARHHKIYQIDIKEASSSILFNNTKIRRRLNQDAIRTLLQALSQKGHAEWLDKEKTRAVIYWRTPEEWASLIYTYVSTMSGPTVCTMYELRESDDVKNQEFYQLDQTLFTKAIRVLEKNEKALTFVGDNGEVGVKFNTK